MDFRTAVRTCFDKYVTFSGRAARPEYWWWALFHFGGGVIFAVTGRILGTELLRELWHLALLLPSLAVASRRLHDIDRSAWWLLLILIPVIGWLVLIYWYVQPTQPGTNRFGPPLPRGQSLHAS